MTKIAVRNLVLLLLGVGACTVDPSAPSITTERMRPKTDSTEVTPVRGSRPEATGSCASYISYGGGRLNQDANVVGVLWGGGVTPEARSLAGFYNELFHTPYMYWMQGEYSVGSGAFRGLYQITPSTNKTSVSENDISNEISYQIAHGGLPSYPSNGVYAVYLPITVTAYLGGGLIDPCDPNAVGGAYHDHISGTSFDFMVIPDTDGCALNNLDGLTSLSTHELIEALTDPDGDNSGWSADNGTGGNCEIADLCAVTPSPDDRLYVPSHADESYLVARIFDDASLQCRITVPNQEQHASLVWKGRPNPRSLYNYVSLWSIPNGTYAMSNQSATGVMTTDSIVGIGDIDVDGQADLVWRNIFTNDIWVWFMRDGVNTTSFSTGATTSDWAVKGLADVDGDGVSDLILMNNSTSEVYVWQLSANGGFYSAASLGFATGMTYLGSGDFNHDGMTDLAFSYSGGVGTTNIAIWLLRGLSVYRVMQPLNYSSSGALNANGLTFGGIGDFNRDGFSDFAWEDGTGTVQLWHAEVVVKDNNVVSIKGPSSAPYPPEPTYLSGAGTYYVSKVADVDGNGASDLIFNYNGDIYTWLLYPQTGGTSYSSVHTGTGGWPLVGASYFNY